MLLWTTYGACQFSLYSQSRELLYPAKQKALNSAVFSAPVANVVSDGVAGAIACCGSTLLTYPFDITRTQFAIQVANARLLIVFN
jgi:hypothetical protein